MRVFYNQSLKPYNTFWVDALAEKIVFLEDKNDIVSFAQSHDSQNIVLGSGSNVLLLRDHYKYVTIIQNSEAPTLIQEDSNHTIVELQAWYKRDRFVQWALDHGYYWLENMGMIPWTIGAGVIGNIGAYGREIGEFIYQIDYKDLDTHQIKSLTQDQYKHSYRRSIFKSLSQYSIISARFIFSTKSYQLDYHYPDIQNYLNHNNIALEELTPKKLYNIICTIRGSKMPSWDERWTAGSFWKNPLVSKEQLHYIKTIDPLVKYFPYKDQYKLAAWWLLENLWYKWKIIRTVSWWSVGCYKHQALLVVNHGATGKEIDQFACSCEDAVYDSYGVKLEREVISL